VSEHFLADIPEVTLWLGRIAANDSTRERLLLDPVLFGHWYAIAGEIIRWPKEAQDLIEAERKKKLSFEQTMALLSKFNAIGAEKAGVDYARRVLEGHSLHFWITHSYPEFTQKAKDAGERLERAALDEQFYAACDRDPRHLSRLGRGVFELTEVLGLSAVQRSILIFAICCVTAYELKALFEGIARGFKTEASAMWAQIFGCSESELSQALSGEGMLRVSGLLNADNSVSLPTVSVLWVNLLTKSPEGLLPVLVQDSKAYLKAGAGIPAQLMQEDLELGSRILRNEATGINLLLYGAQNYDKRKAVHDLIARAEKTLYRLQPQKNAEKEMPAIAYVAQRLLAQRDKNAVLLIEKPKEILDRTPNAFMAFFFGIEKDTSNVEPFDELMLSSNPIPTVWCGSGTDELQAETVARFVFHAPLQRANRKDRRELLEAQLAELELTRATREQLLSLEDVSALQIQTALKAADLSHAVDALEREAALVQSIKRSLNAMHRDSKARRKRSYTDYSIEYLNVAGRFKPEKLLKALRTNIAATLCFYGIPGTGKTQFAQYLADNLGRQLLVYSASQLLSKWVGEAEKNIEQMFARAEAEEAVLLLDEGDSFLRDRSQASQEHEVTRVNELLSRMEAFDGTFILSTNLFRDLDDAALRRFTFKLEFLALTPEQKWKMFLHESGAHEEIDDISPSQREDWHDKLVFMPTLTAGDFDLVKRQCVLLEEVLTPDEWLEQLQIEQNLKSHRLTGMNRVGTRLE
jgi:hypothetical protein